MTAPPDPANSAADLAERALVGALLWDPGRVRDVRDWLAPSDLGHWKSRTIYQTLTGLHRDGHHAQVTDLPDIIAAGTYHDAGGPRGAVTAVDLHTYLKATPATPPASEHYPAAQVRSEHVRYGRMVLEASARALVAAAGSRIQQAAQQAREYPDLGSRSIEATLAEAQQRLAELGTRLRNAHGTATGRIAAALGGPLVDRSKLSGGRDNAGVDEPTEAPARSGAPSPPLTTRAVIEAEHEVLAACLTNPTARTELLQWLTAEDFSRPEFAATWQAYGSLAATGAPVDYVTVAWECERLGGDAGPAGLAPQQLTRMADQTPRDPGPAVETVAHAALLRHTDAAHDKIQSISADRGSDALTVVSAAEQAYRDVGEHARRLSGSPAARRAGATLNRSINDPNPQPRWPTQPPPRPPADPPGRDQHRGR